LDLLAAIERLAPVVALKSSFYAYPLVNALHILSIGVLVTTVTLMDLRILGQFSALQRTAFVRLTRRGAIAGFSGALVTGASMFAIRASEYVFNPAFRLKMLLIALAGANLLMLRMFAFHSEGVPVGNLARVSAGLSIVIWLGALFSGRFIGFL
jgi:hypothetical protein